MTDTIAAAREKLAGVIGEWVSFNTAWSPEGMADAILAALPELTDHRAEAAEAPLPRSRFYGGGGHKNASGFRVPFDHALAR